MQGSNSQRRPSTIADESSHDGRHRVEVGQLKEQLEERTAGRTEEDFATSYCLNRLPQGPRLRKEVPRESKEHATLLDRDSTAQESGVPRLQIGPSDKELFDMYE
ncbi:hypothetical protein I307_00758 [Cryptococcus deuterogattii 99/473]|uniref:Uncharacterized protein n=1 Tax=Cryptococcus deuterogattii Ram5 TaxID=1296110 RepID=A0A0D0V4F0_9TREE|nr:hypothetical protein I313_01503 [Cryptococcus deuterogattii Ram5]KIR72893.1 hypothetical protein I310_03497 [Cryptococcus deuterogattii CA1014]KIS00553.1 hypothetical protein L804_01968 [Cryptococcus deuterogattii 2001/935-1]KIY59686.1 hypothetical protein I307_00758 [Cryptococcus deuterogattii 99/473]